MNYHRRVPEFTLTDKLHKQLVSEILSQQYIPTDISHDRNNLKSNFWSVNFLNNFLFTGDIRSHRLSESMEKQVRDYFHKFIDFINLPCKVRFKTLKNTHWIPPHSDNGARYNGDRCSISVGIIVNDETTNWYEVEEITKIKYLKKKEAAKLVEKVTYLFDNNSLHSVTNCSPKKSRWLLSISWQDIGYAELYQLYQTWITKNDLGN